MKGVLVILDGLGDLPHKALNGQTPLEAAETPNLDFLANRSDMGLLNSVKPGYTPQSDEAIVSIFGNQLSSSTRGQLETRGTDIKLTRGDLAFRTNFATIDSKKENIIDRRAGRTLTTAEAEELAKALNKIKMPKDFVFSSTIQHRGVLVFRGGFSDNISGNDLHYANSKNADKVVQLKPSDDSENAQYSANIVNEFLEKAYEVLNNHPINEKRRQKGLMPANYLLLRGPGIENPKLKFYRKWMSVAYMPLEIGFARTSGMSVFSFPYPRLRKLDVYENLYKSLRKASKFSIRTLKKNYKRFDYAYVHIKETDVPGHDNKPFDKKAMIEHLDKTLFRFLRKFAPAKNVKVIVTGDHSTPCRLKNHSSDPVPVLYFPADGRGPKEQSFSEKEAKKGILGRMTGFELLKKTDFVK